MVSSEKGSSDPTGEGVGAVTSTKPSVFLRNIGFETTSESLQDIINQVVPTRRIAIIRDKASHKSKGYAFAELHSEHDVQKVIRKLDGLVLNGRQLKLEQAFMQQVPFVTKLKWKIEKRIEQGKLNISNVSKLGFEDLNLDQCIALSITTADNQTVPLRPQHVAILVSCLLPSSISIVAIFERTGTDTHQESTESMTTQPSKVHTLGSKKAANTVQKFKDSGTSNQWLVQFKDFTEAAQVAVTLDKLCIPAAIWKDFQKAMQAETRPLHSKGTSLSVGDVRLSTTSVLAFTNSILKSNLPLEDSLWRITAEKFFPDLHIKNLPFDVTKEDVVNFLKPYGFLRSLRLSTTTLLKRENHSGGKKIPCNAGFAFARFRNWECAERAKAENDGTSLKGRRLSVNWAAGKHINQKLSVNIVRLQAPDVTLLSPNSSWTKPREFNMSEGNSIIPPLNVDEDDSESETAAETDFAEPVKKAEPVQSLKTEDSSPSRLPRSGCNEISPAPPSKNPKQAARRKRNDLMEMKTLYVRNLPFSITEEEVRTAFCRFGGIHYARLIRDAQGKCTGGGFIKFYDMTSAADCLAEDARFGQLLTLHPQSDAKESRYCANLPLEGMGIVLHGRRVRVAQAVPSEQVQEIIAKRKKVKLRGKE